MFTLLFSMGKVVGIAAAIVFFVVVSALYFGVAWAFSWNRTVRGKKIVLLNYLLAALTVDVCWAFAFYPHGEYVNRGLGGSFGMMALFPVLLLISGSIVTLCTYFVNRK